MDTMTLLNSIAKELQGVTAPRPSGQLSGHAGGLVFEAMAHQRLVAAAPNRAFRHFEALNEALKSETASGTKPELVRFGDPALHKLVTRGDSALKKWSPQALFEEKQNDTAESILFSDETLKFHSPDVSLIDIKSQNIDKASQAPNIISANKLCEAAKLVMESGEEPTFDILYLGVKFKPIEEEGVKLLRAEEWRAINLFKIDPASLYINWAAALQIQFHPFDVSQSFEGTRKEWFETFLKDCYAVSLAKRINKQQKQLEDILRLVGK